MQQCSDLIQMELNFCSRLIDSDENDRQFKLTTAYDISTCVFEDEIDFRNYNFS